MLVIEELPDSVDVLTAHSEVVLVDVNPRTPQMSSSILEVLLPMKMMIKIGLGRSPVARP